MHLTKCVMPGESRQNNPKQGLIKSLMLNFWPAHPTLGPHSSRIEKIKSVFWLIFLQIYQVGLYGHILRLITTKMWSFTCECGPLMGPHQGTTFSVLYSDINVVPSQQKCGPITR